MFNNDTICALATAHGNGAIAVIRISGSDSFEITDKIFRAKNKKKTIGNQPTHTLVFGTIVDMDQTIDEVLAAIFRHPGSYTGEDTVEISCHGSLFIQQKILQLLIKAGARQARPGEFTQRAFLNGKLDLSQAEAVADLIASSSAASHRVALNQMRGGFTEDLKTLRSRLLNFISLIELELDFSEEEVEFADRKQLSSLLLEINEKISKLVSSFELGNVIKNGIPVAIVGKPNVGKSTLLNVLLNEDRAIVSDIAGTTRDSIEDVISVGGILFRFIDTAGIRETEDVVESLGVERTMQKIEKAEIVIYLFDASEYKNTKAEMHALFERNKEKKWLFVANKSDKLTEEEIENLSVQDFASISISAKQRIGINKIESALLDAIHLSATEIQDTVITNSRHFELLQKAGEAAERASNGIANMISGDFIAQDIREILNYIGEITGEFTTDEVLGNIFKNFCIGK
jgi:tRNA modification GTPase